MVAENNRPHDPSLRELTAELDGLRDLFSSRLDAIERLATERDKWYGDRDKDRQSSVDKALTAVKEQTTQSFAASEKAIVKAEEAQKSYNQSHNDLARKMDEQNKATMPRMETESRFVSQEEKVAVLRSVVDKHSASGEGMRSLWGWIVAAVMSGAALFSIFSKYVPK